MTDNRMTKLESLSKLKNAGRLRYWRGTIEIPEIELHAICDEIQTEHEQVITATMDTEINGETSDGYHTFNELYHHRAVLFSVIVANNRGMAWKAKKHHDGTMYDGMFIVGIDTPWGQASYHYDIDPYWEMFDCIELVYAPEWDGHTPDEAIERIGKLATLGDKDSSVDDALALLDEIYEEGRISYDDYSRLFDTIATIDELEIEVDE